MTIDRKLLEILVCPVTKLPVSLLSDEKLQKLNENIEAGEVESLDGEPVSETLDAALITSNNAVIYPVKDTIPVMLEGRSIACVGLVGFE